MWLRLEFLAAVIAVLWLLAALSDGARGVVLSLWAVISALSLMALLERQRRGLTRRSGGRGWRDLGLAAAAVAIGLLTASAGVFLLTLARALAG